VAPDWELGSPVIPWSPEAQAEIKNAIAKDKTAEIAGRFIRRT